MISRITEVLAGKGVSRMVRYRGGQSVRAGAYFDLSAGQIVLQRYDGEVLPGGSEKGYLKVSLPLAMVMGLFFSVAYVVFLPFIGMAMVIGYSALRGFRLLAWLKEAILPVALPHWVPGEAYFLRLISPRRVSGNEKDNR